MLALIVSCKPQDKKPSGIFPESKMVEVMTDVQIFEAVKESRKIADDSLASFIAAGYNRIYKNHGITDEEFRKSFDYYKHNPAAMDELMTKVIDELSKREGEMKGTETQN